MIFTRKLILAFLTACLFSFTVNAQKQYEIKSPDKVLSAQVIVSNSQIYYTITRNGKAVLENSKLGIVRQDEDFSRNLSLNSVSASKSIKDTYKLVTAKRLNNTYKANQRIFHFQNASDKKLDIIFQVSNDGVAFRYYFPEKTTEIKKISQELSSFNFFKETKAWMQPMDEAKTGFEQSNPSYEQYYQKGIDVGTPSPIKAGWVYPALFNYEDTWLLISEAFLDRNYCATRLAAASPDGEYSVAFPDPRENFYNGPVNPESSLPWYSPWRIIAIGSLKTIVESTLGTDLAKPAIKMDPSFIKPGISSWSWVLLKDASIKYDIQKQFIDYAADMHWQYCLVDANWDTTIGYDKIKELADYAKTKNVGLILWYNSAGNFNTVKFTPRDKLITHESRVAEFSKLQEMGIKGIKSDFFGGDGQSMVNYYLDLFEDAAKYGILINCHGTTLPRGWQRTYPNVMTMEAIKGMEFITFEQRNANEQPALSTIVPFTRNAFDPMDFTPMALYRIPRIQRRTTSAFELALPVIFLSGIQHMAETPVGMATVPAYVKSLLQNFPSSWDDTKFIDGYPGKLTVIARRSGNRWFVAGINGENIDKKLSMDLSFLQKYKNAKLITDGNESLSFTQSDIVPGKNVEVSLKPNGGFVLVVE